MLLQVHDLSPGDVSGVREGSGPVTETRGRGDQEAPLAGEAHPGVTGHIVSGVDSVHKVGGGRDLQLTFPLHHCSCASSEITD